MTSDQYLEALLNLPALVNSQVSPDGKWVAWTWFRAHPTAEVYVAPTDGSAAPVRLTDTLQNTMLVSWTPDNRAVLVQQDHDGDERVQLFRVDLATPGVMQPLTEASPNYFLRGGQLHPNGRWLVYGANFNVATGQEIEAGWVYRHDLETGERLPLARPRKASHSVPKLNSKGTHILYSRSDEHPAGAQVWLVDIEGEQDREILNFGPSVKVHASWLPDGERAMVLQEVDEKYRRIGLWELATGQLRWLIDDPARNFERAFVPYNSSSAVLIEVKNAGVQASWLNLETGIESKLPAVPGNLSLSAPSGTISGEWIASYYSAQQPADLVHFPILTPHPGAFASLTRVWERTSLTPGDLAPAEDFRWPSVDGLEIQGWLYRPREKARGTIIFIHGGPTAHAEDQLNVQVQFFVSQGFNVLTPNYRGSTGFNLAYQEAVKEDGWGGREQDDIRTGIEALIAAGIAEAGKVGVTGTSYGGYSSWCAITRWPPAIVAGSAPICGMTDLVVDYETTRPDLRPYSEEMMGGRPDQLPEKYYERSPIHFVENIKGRLLIVQGLQDPNVTPENVRVVAEALDRAGVKYELLTFEDEGHGIQRPKNQKILLQRLARFFDEAFQQKWGV